jgi:hypothetical protein
MFVARSAAPIRAGRSRYDAGAGYDDYVPKLSALVSYWRKLGNTCPERFWHKTDMAIVLSDVRFWG